MPTIFASHESESSRELKYWLWKIHVILNGIKQGKQHVFLKDLVTKNARLNQ